MRFWSCASCSCTPIRSCSCIDIADRIEPQDRDGAAIRCAQALDALHRRRLAGAVRPDQAEDLAFFDVERHLVHGDDAAVGLADAGDVDDLGHSAH